jgi:hypothetical protein
MQQKNKQVKYYIHDVLISRCLNCISSIKFKCSAEYAQKIALQLLTNFRKNYNQLEHVTKGKKMYYEAPWLYITCKKRNIHNSCRMKKGNVSCK